VVSGSPQKGIGKVGRRQKVGKKGKGSPYSTAEHRVPELIPVLGSHVKSPCLQVT